MTARRGGPNALADRTWAKLALGPEGPAVLAAAVGAVAARRRAGRLRSTGARKPRDGRPGRPLATAERSSSTASAPAELRIAELAGNAVVRSWRITSETPLGEVQLAEPHGNELVVVLKTYTDDRGEYVVLVLRQRGVGGAASRSSPPSGPSPRRSPVSASPGRPSIELGSTAAGAFVDRFDLEVSR